VSKDKKKKKDKKAAKKSSSLKALAQNPLVADVVAAALVATASALKDSKRARALASDASDELAKLSKAGAKSGEALWDMALQIGRRSLETLVRGEEKAPKPAKPKRTSAPSAKKRVKKKSSAPAASR
jgi:hypothetical protein